MTKLKSIYGSQGKKVVPGVCLTKKDEIDTGIMLK